jgi:hypothetical protein
MPSRTLRTAVLALIVSFGFVEAASAYYSPRTGRFLNRDPIGEPGAMVLRRVGASGFMPRDGAVLSTVGGTLPLVAFLPADGGADSHNLYHYARNAPYSHYDPLGLEWVALQSFCKLGPGVTPFLISRRLP